MNEKDRQAIRNKYSRLLDPNRKKHINCVALNSGNTLLHEVTKTVVAFNLQKEGHHYVTEAYFRNGGRCDVLSLDDGIVYEIMVSETKEMLESKSYPEELDVVPVRPNEAFMSFVNEEVDKRRKIAKDRK